MQGRREKLQAQARASAGSQSARGPRPHETDFSFDESLHHKPRTSSIFPPIDHPLAATVRQLPPPERVASQKKMDLASSLPVVITNEVAKRRPMLPAFLAQSKFEIKESSDDFALATLPVQLTPGSKREDVERLAHWFDEAWNLAVRTLFRLCRYSA